MVPGLLSDEGLAAQVKELTATQKATTDAAPPNTSALEFAGQVSTMQAGKLGKVVDQQAAKKAAQAARSDAIGTDIAKAAGGVPGAKELGQLGVLSPERVAAEQQTLIDAAQQQLQTAKDAQELGDMMRGDVQPPDWQTMTPDELRFYQQQAINKQIIPQLNALKDINAAKTTPPKYEWWRNAAEVAARSAAEVGVDTLKFPADIWDLTAETITGEQSRNDFGVLMDGVDKALTKMLPGDPARTKEFVTELSGGVGSMTGFMIGGFATKTLRIGAGWGAGVLGAAVTGNAQYEDAQNFDATVAEKWIALIAGSVLGTTEAIPIDRAFFRADQATGGLVRQLLATTSASSLEEFTQELGQAVGEDLIAKFTYDEKRDLDAGSWLRQAAIGAIVGAGSGAAISLIEQGGASREIEIAKTDDTATMAAAEEAINAAQQSFDTALGPEAADLPGLGGTVDGVPADEAAQAAAGDGAVTGTPVAGAATAPARVDPVVAGDSVRQIVEKAKPAPVEAPASPVQTAADGTQSVVLDASVPVDQQVSVQVAPAVETPQFKQWFGQSKVVDAATGAPQVLYHGTDQRFREFSRTSDIGFHFGDKATAEDRARQIEAGDQTRLMPVYLKADNPLRLPDLNEWGGYELANALRDEGVFTQDEIDALPDVLDRVAVRDALAAKGYDSIVYANRFEGGGTDSYIVFEPTQVKSATKNDGSFDANDPNIDSQVAKPLAPSPDIVAQVDAIQLEPHQVSPLPDIEKGLTGPIARVVQAAKAYANAIGLPHRRQRSYVKVDTARAGRIADAYTAMKHEPNDSAVQAAYRAMADETIAQYQYVKASGIKIETILPGQPDPYPNGPRDVLKDIAAGHIWYFPTESGFGRESIDFPNPAALRVRGKVYRGASHIEALDRAAKALGLTEEQTLEELGTDAGYNVEEGFVTTDGRFVTRAEADRIMAAPPAADTSDNPLLDATDEVSDNGQPMVVNDLFRVVHDFFGHGLEGTGFGARGEENAWQSHMRLFTASAVPAMTSETRGQNSWVNYGPFGAQNRADPRNTTYADQKTGLMPEWTWTEGVVDSTAEDVDAPVGAGTADFEAAFLAAKNASPFGAAVHAYSAAELAKMRTFLAPDGLSGFALKGEDIVSVFSHPRSGGSRARKIIDTAVANGGRTLDCFDGKLVQIYSALGFREVRRENWNDAYRPDGWQDAWGRPDVVYMEYASDVDKLEVATSFYPKAAPGGVVDGLLVRSAVPNTNSISASLEYYTNLGIRRVRMRDFEASLTPVAPDARVRALADAIRSSGELNPLIVVLERDGPYVLEGQHRFDALRLLGKTEFPAMVIVNEEDDGGLDLVRDDPEDVAHDPAQFELALGEPGPDAEDETTATGRSALLAWDDGAAIREPARGRPRPGADGGLVVLYSGAPPHLRVATREMWLTPSRVTAEQFATASKLDAQFDAEGNNVGGAVFSFYARMENPVEIDWQGNMWNKGPDTEYPTVYIVDGQQYDSWGDAEQAQQDIVDQRREAAADAARADVAARFYVTEVGEQFEARLKAQETQTAARVRVLRSNINQWEQALAGNSDLGSVEFYTKRLADFRQELAAAEAAAAASRAAPDEVLGTFDTEAEARDFEAEYEAERVAEAEQAADDKDAPEISEETDYDSEDAGQTTDSVVESARLGGHDGVIFRDVDEGSGPVDVYVVIEPGNAKSTANIGTYNREDPDILRMTGTSSIRQPYALEPTRPQNGVAENPVIEPNDVTLTKIAGNLAKLLNLTVRHGRLVTHSKQVMGEFNRRSGVVRLRTWTDLSTLAHEAGHAINDQMAGALDAFVAAHPAEINALARLYPGDLSQAPLATVRREGFAEFFRLYVMTPETARKRWPQFTADFEALLDREDPQIKTGLNAIAAGVKAWQQMPSGRLIENTVIDGRREQGIGPAMKELRDLGFKSWMQEFTRRNVQWSVNRFAPVNRLVTDLLNEGEQTRGAPIDLARADDPRVLARLARNSGSRGMVQVTDGVIGYKGTQSMSRGLREAIMVAQGVDPNTTPGALDEERLHTFSAYLVARRAAEEFRRFDAGDLDRPPVAYSKGDVAKAIREWEKKYPDFTKAAAIVHEYGMALWQKSYDAGLIAKETYEENLTRQFYVPLQRDMSDKRAVLGDSALTTKGSGPLRSIVKRFRGSDRDVIDPLAILMQKTFALEALIAENDAKKSLALLADRVGQAGALVERIPAQQLIGQQISVREVARQLTGLDDVSDTDAADLLTILGASIKDGDTINLFRSQQAGSKGEPVLFFWENGKVAAIQLKDGDLGADVVNTLNATGRESMDKLLEGVAATSSVFRTAITSWPDFLMVNYIRDQFSAWILTDVGFKPFVSGIRGVIDEVRQKGWAKSYNAAQGIMGGMNVAALHTARVDRDIRTLRSKGYIANVFGDVRSGWDFPNMIKGLARISAVTETGTRLGIYRGAYTRAKAEGLNDYEASVEAGYTATDYIDFGLNGSKMLTSRRLIPFLNAQLQGLYKMVRTLGGDEVAQRKGLKFALTAYFKNINNLPLSRIEKQQLRTGRKAWLKMMSIGLISAALHFLFKDDEDYQEAGEYLRVTGWVIPTGDGRIVYIPKPFELAMVANAVERGLEFASGDGSAIDRFKRGVAFNLTPPTAPPAIQTLVEATNNIDFFTGREIVPSYMQALAPELQYDHTTSSLAKWMGSTFRWSPMVVDHVLGGLGASAYRDLATMTNLADPTRPSMAVTDAPILRRFIRDVRRGSVSAQDFWSQASSTNGALARAAASYKREIDIGNEPAANRRLADMTADQRAYAVLMTHFKADEKRLNPFYRATQVTTLVSGMRREVSSAISLADTTIKDSADTIPLTAKQKREVDTILSEIARREVRNTLIATGQPGWKDKKVLPVEPSIDMLLDVSPTVYDEFQRRWKKRKIYDAQTVYDYWPDVRDRLVQDGEFAVLLDAVKVAGAGL